ncbi:DMT family transporter [Rhodoligotrophos defluvii]|uniref:DMT family transporter n=1 Tax=Rhodoligotrophos defluvii TaxID=2561934 RepID=UPI0010C9ED08|nr:DMT family transporter [Rhodoligotrophos defluvii]
MASVPAAAPASAFHLFKFAGIQGRFSRLVACDGATKGVLLIVLATVFFSVSDIAAKYLTETIGAIQIAWMRYVVFCLLVVPWALYRGGWGMFHTRHPGRQVLRGLYMVLSTILFVTGLAYLDVADATAINFVSPIFITALAIPLLGEKVGIRRWTAAAIGLAGVLIIVQPGSSAFQLAALFPIAAAAVWALAAIITRVMNDTESPQTTLVYSAVVGLAVLSLLVPFEWRMPGMAEIAIGSLIGLSSTLAHWLFVLAYRHANASVLAPFSYIQIIWASGIGFLVFSTLPGLWTYVGGAIIAASGLYTAHRERLVAREAARNEQAAATAEVKPAAGSN